LHPSILERKEVFEVQWVYRSTWEEERREQDKKSREENRQQERKRWLPEDSSCNYSLEISVPCARMLWR
tara:strand:- start:367 stop:573 length:207 start_codon:yes stop_codon:yes gene_type:complete